MNGWIYLVLSMLLVGIMTFAGSMIGGVIGGQRRDR